MKRLLCLNLVLVMLLGMLPATAVAAEATEATEESGYESYLVIDGTEYDATSESISGDGWEYQWNSWRSALYLTDYTGGAIETNVALDIYYEGENTITSTTGHGVCSTKVLGLIPNAGSVEQDSLSVYAAEGYHAVCTDGDLQLAAGHLTLVGGQTSAISAAYIVFTYKSPRVIKVGDDPETAEIGTYTDEVCLLVEPLPCTMTLYGNDGTTEDGEESYSYSIRYFSSTGADIDLYDHKDLFTAEDKSQVGWGVDADGTGTTYALSNSYNFASGNYDYSTDTFDPEGDYDAELYALWDDTHAEIRTVREYSYGTKTWTSTRTQVRALGTSYTLPNVTRDGYVFDGWRGEDGTLYPANTSVEVTGSATYTAEYSVDTQKSLMFRWCAWDSETGAWCEYTDWFDTSLSIPLGYSTILKFYCGTEEDYTAVDFDSLYVTDADGNPSDRIVLTETDGFVRLSAADFGEYKVACTDSEGVEYAMSVTVTLPDLGFYSIPYPSEETYLRSFEKTDTNNVFYLVVNDGILTEVTPDEALEAIATVELSDDSTYAIITVTGEPENGTRYSLQTSYELTDSYSNSRSVGLYLYTNTAGVWDDGSGEGDTESLSGTCGAVTEDDPEGKALTWTLDENGVLTISGKGAMADYADGGAPWYDYADSITGIVVEPGVTSVGRFAFAWCRNATSVELPEGLLSIGHSAFFNCSSLKEITIPASVTSIGEHAIYNTGSLECITVAEGNTAYCNDENGVLFTKDMTTLIKYPENRAENSYVIPAGVTSIRGSAFRISHNLESVEIPSGVTHIEHATFIFCDKLATVTIPRTVTEIGEYVFRDCPAMTVYYEGTKAEWNSIVIASDNDPLTSATIYCAGEPVAPGVASGTCGDNLAWTLDENGVLTISGEGAVQDCSGYSAPWYAYCSSITEIIVEEGVTAIGEWAFAYCDNMKRVSLPESLTTIGYGAFVLCSALTEVTIPANVTQIHAQAFTNCAALTKIVFLGNAPAFGSELFGTNVFPGVTATCYYPADAEGWDDILNAEDNQYGGTLTWVAAGSTDDGSGDSGETEENKLMFRSMYWSEDGYYEDPDANLESRLDTCIDAAGYYKFYFGTEDNCSEVALEDLTTTGGLELTQQSEFVFLHTFEFGEYEVVYTDENGAKYTLPVAIGLPALAFYSESVASEKTYLHGEFTVTEDNSTFYLVPIGCALTDVTLRDELDAVADVELAGDGSYAAITVTGFSGEGRHYMDITFGTANWSNSRSISLNIKNGSDNLTWTLDENGVLTISGEGAMYDYSHSDSPAPWYDYADSITAIVVEPGVTSVGKDAFAWCGKATSVELPEGLLSIGQYAFWNCTSLTEITIPASVTTIFDHAIYNCRALERIIVAEGNTAYCNDEYGVLFTKDMTTLIKYPENCAKTAYVIPDDVTAIQNQAFRMSGNLESVVIPSGVTQIESSTFIFCSKLAAVTIPRTVTEIGGYVFRDCPAMTVYYEGTEAEWNSIVIGSNNDPLTSATIYYEGESDSDTPQIVVSSDRVRAGETLEITVAVKNNPGIVSMKLNLTFDPALTLTEVVCNDAIGGQFTQSQTMSSPVTLNWVNHSADVAGDWTFVTLTFTVAEDAQVGTYPITVTYDPNDLFNLAEDNIEFAVQAGSVEVVDYTPGDINGDGNVNNKDAVRLLQYLSEWDVEVVEAALDINGDGSVNNKDAVRLLQYLSDWDVEIY